MKIITMSLIFPSYNIDKRSSTPYSDATQTKKHPPNHIKRPMNAFMVFSLMHRRRNSSNSQQANLHHAAFSKNLGIMWKTMSQAEQEPYRVEATELKNLHAIEYPNYKYKPKKKTTNTSPLRSIASNSGKVVKRRKKPTKQNIMTQSKSISAGHMSVDNQGEMTFKKSPPAGNISPISCDSSGYSYVPDTPESSSSLDLPDPSVSTGFESSSVETSFPTDSAFWENILKAESGSSVPVFKVLPCAEKSINTLQEFSTHIHTPPLSPQTALQTNPLSSASPLPPATDISPLGVDPEFFHVPNSPQISQIPVGNISLSFDESERFKGEFTLRDALLQRTNAADHTYTVVTSQNAHIGITGVTSHLGSLGTGNSVLPLQSCRPNTNICTSSNRQNLNFVAYSDCSSAATSLSREYIFSAGSSNDDSEHGRDILTLDDFSTNSDIDWSISDLGDLDKYLEPSLNIFRNEDRFTLNHQYRVDRDPVLTSVSIDNML